MIFFRLSFRYKNLIEQRATSPVPFGTTGENNSALTEPGNSSDRNSSSHCTTANNPSTITVPSSMGAKNKYSGGGGGYSSTTGNSAGNSVAVLQNSRPSSATGIVSQVAGYHHRSEPVLQITPDTGSISSSSLDSCHSPRQQQFSAGNRESSPSPSSSSSSWKNQHYSNVNDTAKCIAVGGGGSTASSSIGSSSATNLRYNSTNNDSTFTTSTSTTITTTTASSSSYLSSANSSSSLPSTSSSTTPLSSTGACSSSSSSFGGSSYQRQQPTKSATDSPSTLSSLSSSTINNKDHQHQQRSGSPLSPTFVQHSPAVSPLTTTSTTTSSSSSLLSPTQGGGSSSSSIDTFIKENEQLFGSAGSHRLNSGLLLQRSVGLIEKKPKPTDQQHNNLNLEELVDYGRELQQQLNYIDSGEEDHLSVESGSEEGSDMKIKDSTKLSSLTDDEKALLHETLKAGLYGDPKKKSRQQMFISGQTNGQPNGQLQQQPSKTTAEESDCDSNESASSTSSSSSSSGKPSRRIILISKPAPKPEPKPEPKYVNGKVVFGQLPTPKGLAGGNGSGGGGGGSVLQRGSVAERVMLFEKCPEKTSVTKGKLTELQRSRALGSPNKIGSWVRGSVSTFPNTLWLVVVVVLKRERYFRSRD